MHKVSIRFNLLIMLLVIPCFPIGAYSKTITEKDNEFVITKWTTEDGLPQNTVTSIIQTSDGYIWLATFGGLARFDGDKFTVFNPKSDPPINDSRFSVLFEDSQKTLWIGTETGRIYRYANDIFEEFGSDPKSSRGFVMRISEDGIGNIYISSGTGLEKISRDKSGRMIEGSLRVLSRKVDFDLIRDGNGHIWANRQNDLYLIVEDKLVPAEQLGIDLRDDTREIRFLDSGAVLLAADSTLGILDKGKYEEISPLDFSVHNGEFAVISANGSVWFQQEDHLLEFRGSDAYKHSLAGFVKEGSRVIFKDNEDNLWLGTNRDGLVRLSKRRLSLLGDLTDISIGNTYSVVEDRKGIVWVANSLLLRIEKDKVTSYEKKTNTGTLSQIKTLALDKNDRLWLGGDSGLFEFANDQIIPVPALSNKEIRCMFFDQSGALWLGGPLGVWNYHNGKLKHYTTKEGLVDDRVQYITQTKDGKIWIGTVQGISKYSKGEFENITAENGLLSDNVRDILEDKDGTIWLGTYGGGINRLRGSEIGSIGRENGLINEFVSRILVDNYDRFWILTNLGIFSFSRSEMNNAVDDPRGLLFGSVLGASDGMKYSEANGGHQPAGTKTKDGRLWFPMIEDMVIVDPEKFSKSQPRIIVENVSTIDKGNRIKVSSSKAGPTKLEINDGPRNLEIHYTALSFSSPEKIRFEYKMEGLDEDWVYAGTRRTAYYPYLPSGSFVFKVRAINANGIWSAGTADMPINVAKDFWQTTWFSGLVILALTLIALLIFRNRLAKVRRAKLQQERFSRRLINAQEDERQRIMADLHDGLGQSLLVIKNFAALGIKTSENDKSASYLSRISNVTGEALIEIRNTIRDLGPVNLTRFGLTEAIVNMVEQIGNSSGIVIESKIDKIDGRFTGEIEI
ncbi:MAG: hypothetical protein KDB79_09075, partial [Acidobacteria bacterium]|nr:hypothetical protein [Acidobacteriota bacterium]